MGPQILIQLSLAATLVAWWNALIVAVLLGGWAWVVSQVFDKDAVRHYLPRRPWNAVHVAFGGLAVFVALFLPLPIFITLPIMAGVLALDLLAYFVYHNKDERVPSAFAWSLNPGTWSRPAGAQAKKKKTEAQVKGITMTIAGPDGKVSAPREDATDYAVRVAVEEILGDVLMRRATKAKMGPVKENVYAVVATVDGLTSPVKQLAAQEAFAVVDYLKRAAGLDVNERRKKQRGTISFGFGDAANTEAWVSTLGSSKGVQLSLAVNPADQVDFKVKDLGMLKPQLDALERINDEPGGVVLVTAPPGHGRTSLLYALVREHDAYTSNIQILEHETPRSIEGVRHNVFDPGDGGEYSTVARSILRRDPDVVGIADLPDADTAQVIARADTGVTRVYLGMTEAEPLLAVRAFVKAVGDPKLASESLRGVVAGRLMRKLCENCRFASKPSPEVLQKLNLPKDVQALYRTEGKVMVKDRPEPCPVCGGVGYLHQVAAYAVHTIGDEERAHIANNDEHSLRGAWRQNKQPSIQTSALQLLVDGATSVDELVRVLQGGGVKPQPRSTNPQPAAG